MKNRTDIDFEQQKLLAQEVRKQTGAGLMDAMQVLSKNKWDVEKSVEYFVSGQFRKDNPHLL